ncbi:hypothetical protein Taro_023042 [Colocasia esculenta]|uniref:Uncharacterized protein n=1 Tax=Colocasia esculenta TaxID=4460 RepID=A0A843V358_COLES|nr:hypothetical protein [Colocasia esculenta]
MLRGLPQPREEEEEVMTGGSVVEEEEKAVEKEETAAKDAVSGGDSAPEGEEDAGNDGEGEEIEAEAAQRHSRRPKGKGRMRSRVTWDFCWAWYRVPPEAQQTRIALMGFWHLLAVRPFHVDVPYLEKFDYALPLLGSEGL